MEATGFLFYFWHLITIAIVLGMGGVSHWRPKGLFLFQLCILGGAPNDTL